MKQFSCGDVVPGCQRVFNAADQDAILAAVAQHAAEDHGLPEVPPDVVGAVIEKTVTT